MTNTSLVAPNSDRVMQIVKEIVRALVDYANHQAFKNPKYQKFRLEKN